MKTLVVCVILSLFAAMSHAEERVMVVPVVRVIDGDTIQTRFDMLPAPLSAVKIRILGIDTPEKGYLAKCDNEKLLGAQATKTLRELIGSSITMTLMKFKYDKYGGRVNAVVIVNDTDLGAEMISRGLARSYDGGKKSNWCK